jgi:hypothetical protein
MRKVLTLFMSIPLAFAQSSGLPGAISELENTTRTVLLVSSSIFMVAGIAFIAAGGFIYIRKIRGAYKPKAMLRAAAFALGGLGLIAILAGILGFMIFFMAPGLMRGLLVSP